MATEELERMAVAPADLVLRFHQEIMTLLKERAHPATETLSRVNRLREQLRQEAEGHFDRFGRAAEKHEQELLGQLEVLEDVGERATVVRHLVEGVSRPA